MKSYKWIIILVNGLLVLILFNFSLLKKETLLEEGKLLLVELAPVDPRSLMQGDYMRLSYAISQNINGDSISNRGFCVVKIDDNGIAQRVRLQDNTTPLHTGEYLINYTSGKWDIKIGAESFFFQEGEAEKYEKAKYGGLKVDNKGSSLLIGLYDEQKKLIK